MELVFLAFALWLTNVFCFAVGVKIGQTMVKGTNGEPVIAMPKIITAKKKEKMEKENYDVILENIENYDGTPEGQKDLPWR